MPLFFEGEGYCRMRFMDTVFPDAKLDNACFKTIPGPYTKLPRCAYSAINSMN